MLYFRSTDRQKTAKQCARQLEALISVTNVSFAPAEAVYASKVGTHDMKP